MEQVLSAGFAQCALKQLKNGKLKLALSGGALACPTPIDKSALASGRKRFALGWRKPSRLKLSIRVGDGGITALVQLPPLCVLDARLLAPVSSYWASLAKLVFGAAEQFDAVTAAFPQILDRRDLTASFLSLWAAGLADRASQMLHETSDGGAADALLLRQCVLRLWPLLHMCKDRTPHGEPVADLSLMQEPEQILAFAHELGGWQPFRVGEGLVQTC